MEGLPRGERFGAVEGAAWFALGLGLVVALAAAGVPGALRGDLFNPDTYMRLVRLREMLAVGHALDVVPRDGSGDGVVLHWSHLLDSLLLLLAAPFAPFLGWNAAVRWIAVAFGPLCMGALSAALAWAVAPLSERRWRGLAPLLAVSASPLVAYGIPGVVHHHVLLVLCATMAAGWAGRAVAGVPGSGVRLGGWGALGIWLSPESMPFTMAAFVAVGIAWLWAPSNRHAARAVRDAGTSFLLLVAAAFAADPPLEGPFVPALDRLSVTWLALALACGAAGWGVWACARWLPPRRAAFAGGLLTVLALGSWLAAFPEVELGPGALMPPREARAFLGAIAEMQPVRGAGAEARFLATGALAAGLASLLAWRARSLVWGWASVWSLIALALGALHIRFAAYPAALGAMALPVALTWCGQTVSARRGARSFARPALLAIFLAGPVLGAAFPGVRAGSQAARCPSLPPASLLAPAAGQVVLANPSETPELLYRTRVLTTASLYHRGIASYMRARAAWRAERLAAEPAALAATRARWILLCRAAPRTPLVANLPRDTLEDRLRERRALPWLRRVGSADGWTLWAIRPVSSPSP